MAGTAKSRFMGDLGNVEPFSAQELLGMFQPVPPEVGKNRASEDQAKPPVEFCMAHARLPGQGLEGRRILHLPDDALSCFVDLFNIPWRKFAKGFGGWRLSDDLIQFVGNEFHGLALQVKMPDTALMGRVENLAQGILDRRGGFMAAKVGPVPVSPENRVHRLWQPGDVVTHHLSEMFRRDLDHNGLEGNTGIDFSGDDRIRKIVETTLPLLKAERLFYKRRLGLGMAG
jgi:hypothetical protein